jgi:hypothetical protein
VPDADVQGTVSAGGVPVNAATVTLHLATRATSVLGTATTDVAGHFDIAYTRPVAGVIYAVAKVGTTAHPDPATSPVHLLSVAGVIAPTGGVDPGLLSTLTINERTTVASSYALARFTVGDAISGPSPGLDNAAATGVVGPVPINADNAANDSLPMLNTLADAGAACATAAVLGPCDELLLRATPPGEPAPLTTIEALVDLAENPTLSRPELFALAQTAPSFTPALAAAPLAWVLALHYTALDMFAPGRMAFDAIGNQWISNNWLAFRTSRWRNDPRSALVTGSAP